MTKNSEDIQSSAHVWGDGLVNDPNNRPSRPAVSQQSRQEPTPSDAPPSYTNATSSSSLPTTANTSSATQLQRQPSPTRPHLNPIQSLSLLSSLPFHAYTIPSATLAPTRTITTSTYAPLFSSPASLTKLITDQCSLPPRPLLRIKGIHNDNSAGAVIDFDLVLNLTTLLDLEPHHSNDEDETPSTTTPTSRIHFKELPVDSESSRRPLSPTNGPSRLFRREKSRPDELSPLQKWTTKYVSDKSENKSFIFTRTLPHFIPLQQSLEGALRTLLHTLQYRGKVEVSFPIQYEQVVISKKPTNWFANMLNLHPEKKYDVVESVWQFSGYRLAASSAQSSSTTAVDPITASERSFKQAEANARSLAEEYWGDWREAVRNAVLQGRRGRVGVEDWIESQMGRREKERKGEWGVDWTWDSLAKARALAEGEDWL